MYLLGVIPARAGSRRLPGKNVRRLGGEPLLVRAIRCGTEAGCLDRLIVSTDDPGIAALAVEHGAEVPWLRSAEQSTDEAKVVGAVLEVLERSRADGAPEPDGVVLLQPTSPFRSAETVRRAAALFASGGGDSVVTVSPVRTHPHWTVSLDDKGRMRPFIEGIEAGRAQDLPPAYELNGLVYVAAPATLRAGSFYSEATRALVVEDPREALDIDTPFDWALAESMLDGAVDG